MEKKTKARNSINKITNKCSRTTAKTKAKPTKEIFKNTHKKINAYIKQMAHWKHVVHWSCILKLMFLIYFHSLLSFLSFCLLHVWFVIGIIHGIFQWRRDEERVKLVFGWWKLANKSLKCVVLKFSVASLTLSGWVARLQAPCLRFRTFQIHVRKMKDWVVLREELRTSLHYITFLI